ncbi:pyridoxal-dependent decarboxylase domain-containing protein 1-like isoform X2 [Watersipora subatra]|uniref:pyridoxal-dependent decarboxylase domain-containing protein 1-like isoform X2 n=1 Tax=Watersipora subatra TaxID=2589382 RepID=UPI00355C951D
MAERSSGMTIDRSLPNGTANDMGIPDNVSKMIGEDASAKRFYGMMGPQVAQLEKDMAESMKVLDDMNKKWKDDREARQKAEIQKHVPQPLKNSGQSLIKISKRIGGLFRYTNFPEKYVEKVEKSNAGTDMLKAVEELQASLKTVVPTGADGEVVAEETSTASPAQEESDDDEFVDDGLIPSELPELTEVDRALLLSHSMAAYTTKLTPEHRRRFYTRILNDTTQWITALFRIKESTAMYHDDKNSGLINVCKLALVAKYPDYLEKGFDCLYSKPPVLYISAAGAPNLSTTLARGLGLPESCICVVPCKSPEPGQIHKMDADAFESLVNDHIASTREPVFLLAYASTPHLAAVDPLQKLKTICKANNIWLHIEGLNLASLCLMSVPTNMLSARTSDSCTLDLASWFGFACSPFVTVYRQESESTAVALNITTDCTNEKLKCLPLWIALQFVGIDGMVARVKTAVQMASDVLQFLTQIPTISILNKKAPERKKGSMEYSGFGDFVSKLLSAILVFEMATPVVVFQYGKSSEAPLQDVAPYATQEQIEQKQLDDDRLGRYFESLNIWFVETVKRVCPSICLETIRVDGMGTAIKFSPLEHGYAIETVEDKMKQFMKVAREQLSVMDATVSHRESFMEVVEAQDNLLYIEMPGYAGIGAVQYIPTDWLETLPELPDKGKAEVNKINMELVHQLKANDSAFSLGSTEDGLACARFGLISQETDMEELLGLVYTTGKEIEESSRFVEQMAEMVKQGIEQANQDLEKENESRLMQEGVLRQIPMVSSLVNWFSPPPKEMGNMKGRAFNLTSGKIKSTEETYKNHMQILEQQPPVVKRQQPLKAILKPAAGAAQSSLPTSPTFSESDADASLSQTSQANASTSESETSSANSSASSSTVISESPSASSSGSSNASAGSVIVKEPPNEIDLK